MKRLSSAESLGALMSICPNSTAGGDEDGNNSRDFQAMLEDEELGQLVGVGEKKRRLSMDQVRALEKNFEVVNKLEPERKVKLAQELGLQPRQVAVWFQNRRARWKTKQLEKDYGVLKAGYDGLKLSFEKLQHDNEALLKEIGELKSKLNEDSQKCVKEEGIVSDTEDHQKTNLGDQTPVSENYLMNESKTLGQQQISVVSMFFTDGSSADSSDSSAILNEDNSNSNSNSHSPTAAVSSYSSGIILGKQLGSSSSPMGYQVSESTAGTTTTFQAQFVKIEEHDFFGDGEEESCSGLMFAEEQAPSLHWYSSDLMNGTDLLN